MDKKELGSFILCEKGHHYSIYRCKYCGALTANKYFRNDWKGNCKLCGNGINTYITNGDTTRCIVKTPSGVYSFKFDTDIAHIIKKTIWHATTQCSRQATFRTGFGEKRKQLSTVIAEAYGLDLSKGILTHINADSSDFTRENLMVADKNVHYHTKILNRKNKSGTTGVHWHNRNKCWVAYISVDKRRIHLGSFKDKDMAIATRKKAEVEYKCKA